jgi:polyisoprenoid-binding protein YceI
MDMTSITVLDQEGGGKTKLEGHLKSDDFFGVEKYPTSTLVVTKTVSKGEGQYAVTADLTIKGITHPINFDAVLKLGSDRATVTADLKIDRTLYDVRYGSGKFFDDLGDKTIDDIFELNVKIVAVDRQNN